ncbi:hypothetical protein OKW41_001113 [Paraburkholderia sp. UCT70]|uniref:hypothetical protein n=1 Tax=Paraburkholderia sp. UCT70 TaxID=2991068 RepID=UPI003D1FB811
MHIDGRLAAPAHISAPVLAVFNPRSRVIPPVSIVPAVHRGFGDAQLRTLQRRVKARRSNRARELARMEQLPVVLCIADTTELNFNGQDIDGVVPLSYEAQVGMYARCAAQRLLAGARSVDGRRPDCRERAEGSRSVRIRREVQFYSLKFG